MTELEAMKRDIELLKIVQRTLNARDKNTDTRRIPDSRK
jgi:hypothetical protein